MTTMPIRTNFRIKKDVVFLFCAFSLPCNVASSLCNLSLPRATHHLTGSSSPLHSGTRLSSLKHAVPWMLLQQQPLEWTGLFQGVRVTVIYSTANQRKKHSFNDLHVVI